MSRRKPDYYNFLKGAAGYLAGAAAGILFIFLASRLELARWLAGITDDSQPLVHLLARLVFAWLLFALAGAILGGLGGWTLGSILGIARKRRQVMGSALAFGITVATLGLVFLLLIGFIGIYNNFTANRIEHYALLFGLFWLVFGLVTGIFQGLMSLRLGDAWRVILAGTLGFTAGGILMGLLVRLVNPTAGFQTTPILTWSVLILALACPFAFGGGALGCAYGRLARRAAHNDEKVETLQPSAWQTGITAGVGVVLGLAVLSVVGNLKSFVTINPAPIQEQISSETIGVWWTEPLPLAEELDEGQFQADPEGVVVVIGADDVQHKASCTPDGSIQYQQGDEAVEEIGFPPCSGLPALGLDNDGIPHLVWFTTKIMDTNGEMNPGSWLMESIRSPQGWSEAALVTETSGPATPILSLSEQGSLVLVWKDADGSLYTSLQEDYACDEIGLNALEKAGLASILAGDYRPEGSEIPYCRNEYMRIYYTPNPDPNYSDLEPTMNGGFDQVARISDTAQYEVLFTTMQWEPNTDPPNPGSVLGEAAAVLYNAVKENPERYPRGMTVRILLGNYPVMSDFEYGSQIWEAIADLRAAGVDKMVDPAIGWRLEIANYGGTYPHAHTKFVVVDGKRTAAMGFNYGYLHFPKDHVSGRGYDLFDLGLLVSGPVAQDSIAAYDDMWNGANQVHCEDLSQENEDWRDSCTELKATVDHVPEVLRTYLPPAGNTNAFSLYRTTVRAEADAFLYESLVSTQESIDAIEVNFSLEMVCMLNLVIPDFCTFEDALPWMNAMLEAIETNGVKLRVIMENTNSNGLENRVGGSVFLEEIERRGLQDQVELRFYNGKLHAKSMLMDEALLVIGSQNLHYSSWGEGGLAEYNVTTNDPQAIEEYKAMFEAKWAEATGFWETEYGTSP